MFLAGLGASGCMINQWQHIGSDGPDKGECGGVQMLLRFGRHSQPRGPGWTNSGTRRSGSVQDNNKQLLLTSGEFMESLFFEVAARKQPSIGAMVLCRRARNSGD
ncbi:uncharacterized protein LOC123426184 isoform X4 [Hordeum vulgare subsp. vulgare]|uniref:uncharacterized protein LOC123426184 isoform X4 n=1 Tax=Hordeum vulgare subsp. vulgare TaxID=112509 RepID=UPI00162F0B56|nr:uncharacterized protein LOC123426184 isoform X4 [Hordeum vulgare subsp. vulgare]